MQWMLWALSGGWAKDYRTQLLGIGTALTGIGNAFFLWATGDATLVSFLQVMQEQWPPLVAGLSLWFVGDKLNGVAGKPEVAVEKPK